MHSGTYILEAESAYYTFEPVTAAIDSSADTLPDLVADRVQVCGKLELEKSEMSKYTGERRIVMIKAKGGYQEQKMQVNEQGEFCMEVKMGEYTVIPQVNLDETSYGLHLSPHSHEIKVEGDPIKDLRFSQIKVSLTGKVKCFDPEECKDVSIQLSGLHETTQSTKATKNTFTFASVLPGKYKLSIIKPDFCWQESDINVEIKSQNIKDIEFIQTGYALQYDAAKDVEVLISGKNTPILFKEGVNSYCLSAKGEYVLTPTGCYKFAEPTIQYNTATPKIVKLLPEKYLIEGVLISPDTSLSAIQQYVTVSVKFVGAPEEILKVTESPKQKNHFTFSFYAKKGAVVQLTPILKQTTDGNEPNILFYPRTHEVKVTDRCLQGNDAITFKANKGLILRGKITPPIAGIEIIARDIHDNTIAASTVSQSNGEYKLGPLYENENKYTVSAQKPGYKLLKDEANPYNFIAEQLSFLTISAISSDGIPLPGVIFDLSHSGRTYRNNTRSNEKGMAYFEQLISGDYYLKPLLKEYKFEPEQMTLKIIQGDHKNVDFKAYRVAFSAYGKVELFNQKPIQNIAVDAVCISCEIKSMESSTTDSQGKFRIRGLQPKQKYEIYVRQDSDRIFFIEPNLKKQQFSKLLLKKLPLWLVKLMFKI